jgi:hypothetical protein
MSRLQPREGGHRSYSRVNTNGGKEFLHDMTHATRRSRENDNWVLRYKPLDSCLRGFCFVDGLRRGQGGVQWGTEVEKIDVVRATLS